MDQLYFSNRFFFFFLVYWNVQAHSAVMRETGSGWKVMQNEIMKAKYFVF